MYKNYLIMISWKKEIVAASETQAKEVREGNENLAVIS